MVAPSPFLLIASAVGGLKCSKWDWHLEHVTRGPLRWESPVLVSGVTIWKFLVIFAQEPRFFSFCMDPRKLCSWSCPQRSHPLSLLRSELIQFITGISHSFWCPVTPFSCLNDATFPFNSTVQIICRDLEQKRMVEGDGVGQPNKIS